MLLEKAFVTDNDTIELPGPDYKPPRPRDYPMSFNDDFINGVKNIFPLLLRYEIAIRKKILTLKLYETPKGIKEAIENSPGWKFDIYQRKITFLLDEPDED